MRSKGVIVGAIVLTVVLLAGYGVWYDLDSAPATRAQTAPNVRRTPDLASVEMSARGTAEAHLATAQAASARQTAIAATATASGARIVAEAQAEFYAEQARLENVRQSALAQYDAALYAYAVTQAAGDITATAEWRATERAATATQQHMEYVKAENSLRVDFLWKITLWGGVVVVVVFVLASLANIQQRGLDIVSKVSNYIGGVFVRQDANGSTTYINPARLPGAVTVTETGTIETPVEFEANDYLKLAEQDNYVRAIAALPGLTPKEREQLTKIVLPQLEAGGGREPYKIYTGQIETLPPEIKRRLEETWNAGLLESGTE